MNNTERVLFGFVLFAAGVAAGMYFEHQRFIKEVQGLSKKHADTTPAAETPAPQPEVAA